MSYVMLFLLTRGGTKALGEFSAIVSITAPICMFLMFRCVESIALAQDKKREYSILLIGATTIFLTLSPLFYLAAQYLGVNPLFSLLILAFKPLEMAAELTTTAFMASERKNWAARSMLIRTAGVVAISLLFTLATDLSPLTTVGIALFFSYSAVFLLYDFRRLRSSDLLGLFGVLQIARYLMRNFGLGALNFSISFNSSMPRYVLAEQAGLATLGTFALMHQIASTLVNIVQYPVSLQAANVLFFVRRHAKLFRAICLTGIAAASLGLILALTAVAPELIPEALTYRYIALVGVLTLFMLLALMTRGIILTALIASQRHLKMYLLIVASTAAAAAISSPVLFSSEFSPSIYGATVYTALSCLFAGVLALRRIVRVGGTAAPH